MYRVAIPMNYKQELVFLRDILRHFEVFSTNYGFYLPVL